MLIAVAEIVLEVIALILQGVERFIFDAPAGSSSLHDAVNCSLIDAQVGDPTEMLDFVPHRLPALDKVDPQGGLGCIERHVTDKTKPMMQTLLSVMTVIIGHATGAFRFGHVLEQKGMIAFFDPQNIAHIMLM